MLVSALYDLMKKKVSIQRGEKLLCDKNLLRKI